MSTVLEERDQDTVVIAPFTIEADHPRMCDLWIRNIPGARMRSALDGSKGAKDAKTGIYRVPADQARSMASFPKLPGQHLYVNPFQLMYRITDPLFGDEETLAQVARWMKENYAFSSESKLQGCKPMEGELDKHQMKSLCKEMWHLVKAGECKLVDGQMPSMEDIKKLPGEFLLNPGCVVPNLQPRYEKDYEDWKDRLMLGGG
jgi:hypothetical protein